MRILSFIDQPGVIKKILQDIGLWEESHALLEETLDKRDYLRSFLQPAYDKSLYSSREQLSSRTRLTGSS